MERYTIAITEELLAVRADADAIKGDVSLVKDYVIDEHTRRHSHEQESKRQHLRQWLSKCDPEPSYEAALQKVDSGSGRWFLEHDFQTWLEGDWDDGPNTMWLHGRSGTGKTVLLSSAINYVRRMRPLSLVSAAAYFYCSFSDKESQNPANVLGSYIVQLCMQVPEIWDLVTSLYAEVESRQHTGNAQPTAEELQKVLDCACGSTAKTLLFLDAPNESDMSERLLLLLSDLVRHQRNLRILISSTEEIDVTASCKSCDPILPVKMDPSRVNEDIASFVDTRMQTETSLRRLPRSLQSDINLVLVNNARGS